ncbi:hypothetical protein [Luteitalea pratensis]|uniref:hypothetical protein n=1 Tax=Luteitalea pratensis TaxID=1855912 RepID=UPI00138FA22B|nr:hypothetical protein [Luteitalea pratensis]
MIEGLLNFARLEAGELDYSFESVDPGPYLREIVADFRRDISGRDVGIELTGDEVAIAGHSSRPRGAWASLLEPARQRREVLA